MSNIVTEEFVLTLKYQMKVDTETGEVLEQTLIERSVNKADAPKKATKKVKSEDANQEPTLTLEDNKYCLNDAAVELMQLDSNSKLDIKYEQRNGRTIPVIGTDEAFGTKGGNKLTKSNTVACRGSKNEELQKYGTTFTISAHETKAGLFILKGDKEVIPEPIDEEDPDESVSLPEDVSLADLVDVEDANVTEIDSSFFKL